MQMDFFRDGRDPSKHRIPSDRSFYPLARRHAEQKLKMGMQVTRDTLSSTWMSALRNVLSSEMTEMLLEARCAINRRSFWKTQEPRPWPNQLRIMQWGLLPPLLYRLPAWPVLRLDHYSCVCTFRAHEPAMPLWWTESSISLIYSIHFITRLKNSPLSRRKLRESWFSLHDRNLLFLLSHIILLTNHSPWSGRLLSLNSTFCAFCPVETTKAKLIDIF